MDISPQAQARSLDDEADVVDRWQWLGVVGAGLIAAAITAIALPSMEEEARLSSAAAPITPTVQQTTP